MWNLYTKMYIILNKTKNPPRKRGGFLYKQFYFVVASVPGIEDYVYGFFQTA